MKPILTLVLLIFLAPLNSALITAPEEETQQVLPPRQINDKEQFHFKFQERLERTSGLQYMQYHLTNLAKDS